MLAEPRTQRLRRTVSRRARISLLVPAKGLIQGRHRPRRDRRGLRCEGGQGHRPGPGRLPRRVVRPVQGARPDPRGRGQGVLRPPDRDTPRHRPESPDPAEVQRHSHPHPLRLQGRQDRRHPHRARYEGQRGQPGQAAPVTTGCLTGGAGRPIDRPPRRHLLVQLRRAQGASVSRTSAALAMARSTRRRTVGRRCRRGCSRVGGVPETASRDDKWHDRDHVTSRRDQGVRRPTSPHGPRRIAVRESARNSHRHPSTIPAR
ncbi:hypothetical protein SGPA1_12131 [Streptomyces misionensis JCM 4497]